jgi:hypothetical protein
MPLQEMLLCAVKDEFRSLWDALEPEDVILAIVTMALISISRC